MSQKQIIHQLSLGDKVLVIKVKEFDVDGIDIDQLLQINYQRLPAEMVTFPVILNKLGLLLADAENCIKEANLDLEIYIAKKREEIRCDLNSNKRAERLSQDDIKYKQESDLKSDAGFQARSKKLFKAEKNCAYMKSVYWSAKDKSDKLNKLGEKMHQDDISYDLDKVAGIINGVNVKII